MPTPKILLIYPRFNGDSSGSGSLHPPLGVCYLSSYLESYGKIVDILDLTFYNNWSNVYNKVKSISPDIVGISFSSPLAHYAFQCIHLIRQIKNVPIIAGGPHPSLAPADALNKGADIAVMGEGEEIFLKIIESLEIGKSYKNINAIAYKHNGAITVNERDGFIHNLDDIPMPAIEKLDLDKYIKKTKRVTVITSRGCPGRCYYCQPAISKMFGRRIRRNSPERVMQEVIRIKQNAPARNKFIIEFVDDVFTWNSNWIKKFTEYYKEERIRIPFWIISRADLFNNDIARMLKSAGCIGISFGVETGSEKLLTQMKKDISTTQIINSFDICHKIGLLTVAFWMVGTPGETEEDFVQSLKLMRRLHPDISAVSLTTPMIGSELYYGIKDSHGDLVIENYNQYGYYSKAASYFKGNERKIIQKRKAILQRASFISTYKNLPKYFNMCFHAQSSTYFRIFIDSLKNRIPYMRIFG